MDHPISYSSQMEVCSGCQLTVGDVLQLLRNCLVGISRKMAEKQQPEERRVFFGWINTIQRASRICDGMSRGVMGT